MATPFTVIVTSDRYGSEASTLDGEREMLRRFPDLDVNLRGALANTEDDLIALSHEADALLLSTRDAISRRVCENIGRTRVIARYGVGLDNVDLDAAADHGIVITHYPQYCTSEVADHAVSLLLTMNRRIVEQNEDLHSGAWNDKKAITTQILRGTVPALRTLNIGVVAFGRIGAEVVARLKPFGARIVVADPYVDDEVIRAAGAEPVSLDELVSQSDMFTIHCPLMPATRGFIGPDQFAKMKPNVVIVNTARGPTIDQAALIGFLESHPEARAALDVVEIEPLPKDSPLWTIPNVILTPHSAYYSEQSVATVREQTFLSAIAVLRGYLPPTVANPAVLERVKLSPQPA